MNEFIVFLKLGLEHITDIKGFDHILFILLLCCIYDYKDWKKLAFLVSAFTLGHSVTLILSAFKIIVLNIPLIELCIALTIFSTAMLNIFMFSKQKNIKNIHHYLLAMIFGLIHGMGFSIFFSGLLFQESSILLPLVAFNIGLEIGQLIILILCVGVYFTANRFFKLSQRPWMIFVSSVGLLLSAYMVIERFQKI